jgi:hypothetical protein
MEGSLIVKNSAVGANFIIILPLKGASDEKV